MSDSTNAERAGRTESESAVAEALHGIIAAAAGRVVVACFASNLHRIQQICTAAEGAGRHVAFVGRSMVANVEVGRELGHLRVRGDTIVDIETAQQLPRSKVVIACTGSQGEPLSALALIAAGEHKWVDVGRGDTVILSAMPIPGNEAAVHRVINAFYKSGADVFHGSASGVHVSGHAASEELAEMIAAVRPRHFVPVHGEYRQMALHARIARDQGVPEKSIFLVEDGDVLELGDGSLARGEQIAAGTVLVDGLGVGDVGPLVLRDRKVLAGDGIIVCVVTIDPHSGRVVAGPDVITRGFVHEDESRDFLDEAADRVADALEDLEADQVVEWGVIKKTCRRALGELVWQRTRRRPMILPIVMEI